jgi:integrase
MAATVLKGAPPRGVRAHRQWLDPETGKWKGVVDKHGAKVDSPKGVRTRWRAQASVRLWTGEVVKRDATGQTRVSAENRVVSVLQDLLDASSAERARTDYTVAEVTALWLDAPARFTVGANSLALYEGSARRWLVPDEAKARPALVRVRVRRLEPRDVNAWLLDIAARTGIPTAKTARSVLSTICRWAIDEGHASTNPVRDATTPNPRVVEAARERLTAKVGEVSVPMRKRPGPGAQLDHKRALTVHEVARTIAAATSTQTWVDQDLADLIALLDGTGVRLGGALATRWADVDLDGNGPAVAAGKDPSRAWVLAGAHTITRVTGEGLVRTAHGDTKKGVRWLAIDEHLADRLRKRRVEHPDHEYLFPNPVQPTKPREVSDTTKRLRRLFDSVAGDDGCPLTWASSHSFRRTLTTDLHDAGVPDRQIAGQGGWKRVGVMQDHYFAEVPESTVAADLRTAQRAEAGRRGDAAVAGATAYEGP